MKKQKLVIGIFFTGLALLCGVEFWLVWLTLHSFSTTAWRAVPAGLMIGGGMALVIWSVRSLYLLGFGTPAPAVPTLRLVQAGPYRFTRNPMTLGAGMFYLGCAVWTGAWLVFFLVMLIFALLLSYIHNHESRELEERFGVEYKRYRSTIPFLIPRIPR